MPYLEGVKQHMLWRNFASNRVKFVIANGKEVFRRELWIVDKKEKLSELKKADKSLDNLKEKYLFSSTCVICEPAEPQLSVGLIDWKFLAEVLKRNPSYKVLLEIDKEYKHYDYSRKKMKSAKKYAKKLQKDFVEKHKVEKNIFNFKSVKEKGNLRIHIIPIDRC